MSREFFSGERKEKPKIISRRLISEADLHQYFSRIIAEDKRLKPEQVDEMANTLTKKRLSEAADLNRNYFGAFEGNKLVGFGSLVINKVGNYRYGDLDTLEVDPDYRGKGVADSLTDARLEFARQNGCERVNTEVDVDNQKGMITKFKNGFILYDYDIVLNRFIFTKQLKTEMNFDRKQGPLGELKEISLADLEGICDLLTKGYSGIDIKNIGDVDDPDTNKWVLIFESSRK